jgi:2-polyprenyl-3-methyl-5-hydroxy-6-metoxy-1,4-benzoquinol methylase
VRRPQNNADLRKLYDHLYSSPTSGKWRYGEEKDREREPWFFQKVLALAPKGSRVLDASCGRGHLARDLAVAGYEVEVTEHSSVLVENDLRDLKAHLLSYDELDQLPARSFDVVISNDVLEHLPDEAHVRRALVNLERLSRNLVILTAARNRSTKWSEELLGMKFDLHLFHEGEEWWKHRCSGLFEVLEFVKQRGRIHVVGRVRT